MERIKKHLPSWGRRETILSLLLSFVFGTVYALGRNVVYDGGIKGYPTENYMTMPKPVDALLLLLSALVFFVVLIIIYALCSRFELLGKGRGTGIKFKLFVIAFLFLAWMPYLLSFYPGAVQGDSFWSMDQMIELGRPDNNHHPIVYTLFIGIFMKIGELVSDYNVGVFCYCICQMLLMSLTISRVLSYMREKGAGILPIAVTLVFYAFEPLFPAYSISLWKDPLFSCAMLLLSIEIYECAITGAFSGKRLLRIVLLTLAVCFLRNNGIYVIIASALALTIVLKKQRIKVAAVFALIVAFYFALTSIGYKKLGIEQQFVESVGIPIQQMGAVIYYDGEMTEEDEQYAYELMLQWWWQENYAPCLVDQIKWNYFFNDDILEMTKGDFIRTWLNMVKNNPVIAVRAYIMETHGFWKWGVQDNYGYIELLPEVINSVDKYGIRMRDAFADIFGFSLAEQMKNAPANIGSGTLLWITVASMLLCILKRRYLSWLFYVPCMANWFCIMIATPAAYGMRYVYIFVIALPLYLLMPFIKSEKM